MATVVLLGTLDTKGHEYAFLRERLLAAGLEVLVVDAGTQGEPQIAADVPRAELLAAAGADVAQLGAAGVRADAVEAAAAGARAVLLRLHAEGRLDGVLALGGSGGSAIAGGAMQALPVGVPKLLVSTMASGDTRSYVGTADVTLMHSVVDVAGLNRLSRRILGNAAAAIAGMVSAQAAERDARAEDDGDDGSRPLVAATMFGVTTPAVTAARARLEQHGYEVLVFHANGVGGATMEALVRDGYVQGVLDLTTTELADELVGGIATAGPHRVEAAGAAGIPQVVAPGALDIANFGAPDSVPARYAERLLYRHNPNATLMRTSAEECAQLGATLAAKLRAGHGPRALHLPLRGLSALDVAGRPFHDPEADRALFDALRAGCDEEISVHEADVDVNDPSFAETMADDLHALMQEAGR
jgi:uncharacterized protein (UPF0261 family)